MSEFVFKGLYESAKTVSGNNAPKFSTSGFDFVDQFGMLGKMKEQRSFEDIACDMNKLWSIDPDKTVKFTLYIRMITRVTDINGQKTETVQRGAGLKHEGIQRMRWLSIYHPDKFWNNLHLFLAVGSWKDIIKMLSYDLSNGWSNRLCDWNAISKVIIAGLENPNTVNLVKKYLPHIKARSKAHGTEAKNDTIIGKWLASKLFPNDPQKYKKYRQLKASGTAHQWQQQISKADFQIDFDTVHGRALSLLVSSKFLENQNLEEVYEKWIDSKEVAKFTGWPHELFKNVDNLKRYQVSTLNKQFETLVETAKKDAVTDTSMIVVRDTSGSMMIQPSGVNMSCGDIAKALALFFSEMLPNGAFADSWIEFNKDAELHKWVGNTPYEKWVTDQSDYIGNTNFQSVIDLFINIKRSGVKESEFPTGIICISDSEFDASDLEKTNVETALNKLSNHFSEEYVKNFKIVLWNLQSNYYGDDTGCKFETYGEVENVFYFSGYDASVMTFLTGTKESEVQSTPKTAQELFDAAMNQEVLRMTL